MKIVIVIVIISHSRTVIPEIDGEILQIEGSMLVFPVGEVIECSFGFRWNCKGDNRNYTIHEQTFLSSSLSSQSHSLVISSYHRFNHVLKSTYWESGMANFSTWPY